MLCARDLIIHTSIHRSSNLSAAHDTRVRVHEATNERRRVRESAMYRADR